MLAATLISKGCSQTIKGPSSPHCSRALKTAKPWRNVERYGKRQRLPLVSDVITFIFIFTVCIGWLLDTLSQVKARSVVVYIGWLPHRKQVFPLHCIWWLSVWNPWFLKHCIGWLPDIKPAYLLREYRVITPLRTTIFSTKYRVITRLEKTIYFP